MASVDFTCKVTKVSVELNHFWEHTVGSSPATMALREDWRKQFKSQLHWLTLRDASTARSIISSIAVGIISQFIILSIYI